MLPFNRAEKYITYKVTDTGGTTAALGVYIYDTALYTNLSYKSPVYTDMLGLATTNCANQYWSLTFNKNVLVNDVPYTKGQSVSWHYTSVVPQRVVLNE